MDPFRQHPDRRPDPYDFVPPALSASLTAAIVALLAVALHRFLAVAPRLGIDAEGRRIFIVVVAVLEAVLVWQAGRQGRKALRLWRGARS